MQWCRSWYLALLYFTILPFYFKLYISVPPFWFKCSFKAPTSTWQSWLLSPFFLYSSLSHSTLQVSFLVTSVSISVTLTHEIARFTCFFVPWSCVIDFFLVTKRREILRCFNFDQVLDSLCLILSLTAPSFNLFLTQESEVSIFCLVWIN
jgi:hypothetical protein